MRQREEIQEVLRKMTIPLKQVIRAIEEANEVFTSFWDAKTGKTVYLADPLMTDMTEEDKALASAIEDMPERFLRFPTKHEIHQYRMMEDFISALSRKGAGGTCLCHPGKRRVPPVQAVCALSRAGTALV